MKAIFDIFSTFFINEEVAFKHTSFHLIKSLTFSRNCFVSFSRVAFFHGKEVRNFDNFNEEFFFTAQKNTT